MHCLKVSHTVLRTHKTRIVNAKKIKYLFSINLVSWVKKMLIQVE